MKTKFNLMFLVLLFIVVSASIATMVIGIVLVSDRQDNEQLPSNADNTDIINVSFDTGTETVLVDMNISVNMYYSLPTMQREGYLFAGWYIGDTPIAMSGSWTITDNVTLTAKWIIEGYEVSFATNTQDKINSIILEYGSQYSLPQPQPKAGYTFEGWTYGNVPVDSQGIWSINSDVVLVAKWSANVYTVSFESGTEQVLSDIELVYDTYYNLPQPKEREGYSFIGWVDNEGTNVLSSGVWKVAGDIQLTAKWQPNRYNVTLAYNNGQEDQNLTVTYGEDYQLAVLEKNGYNFAGWYNDILSVPIQGKWNIAQDVVLVAKWEAVAGTPGLVYELIDNAYYVVSDYTGNDPNVVVPAEYFGKPVTKIGNGALSYPYIKKVTLPSSIIEICDNAFKNTTNLEQLNLSEGLTLIGSNAFLYSGLRSIVLPKTVNQFRASAFGNSELNDVTILGQNITIDETAFDRVTPERFTCYAEVFEQVPITGVKYANILGGVLSKGIFSNCTNIEEVIIDDSVTSLPDSLFYNCTNLSKVTLPSNLSSLPTSAFYNCSSLTNLTLPNSVTSIGSSAFYGCASLVDVVIPDTVNSLGSNAFANCDKLVSLEIPFIGASESSTNNRYLHYLFGGSYSNIPSSLVTVKVNRGVLNSQELSNVSNVQNIIIGKGVTSVTNTAFDDDLTIYYEGTQTEWEKIASGAFSQQVYFYSESNPFEGDNAVTEGNFWHYVDNVITVWTNVIIDDKV